MESPEYELMHAVEDRMWWYRGLRRLVVDQLTRALSIAQGPGPVLDAGCGTGMLAIEAARRGAEVVGIDVSPQLIEIGKERLPEDFRAKISLHAGDMLDASFGQFDHIVSMDVLIHYESDQIAAATAKLAERTRHSMLFTFAPGTPLLRTARAIGQFFPKSDRSPSIIPVAHDLLKARLSRSVPQAKLGRDQRISRGFYTSHAQEVLLG